jgi:hypothetical protein
MYTQIRRLSGNLKRASNEGLEGPLARALMRDAAASIDHLLRELDEIDTDREGDR